MGFGSTANSSLTITDMDTIERSNLTRQFLFRNDHIGQMKSDIAAREITKINPTVTVNSQQNKVCQETENTYNDIFFNKIDGVANALDNIQARKFVDQLCISNSVPLFESGTEGTKGNTQVIIPRLTENYGASQDQQQVTYPVCTIKNFPNSIDHTISWAKDSFTEYFINMPNAWNKYCENPNFIKSLSGNEKGEIVRNILYLWLRIPKSYNDCVNIALDIFNQKFNNHIIKLLESYPPDLITSTGDPFWSAAKRCPGPIDFNIKNKMHI